MGNGLWVKLSMTVKLRDRFITGIKHWVQENGKPMPLLLNTAVTNSDVRVASIDGSPSRLFLKEGDIKGFSDIKEILVTFKRNGHVRIFHGCWDKETCEDSRTLFKFKAWEEKPREEKKEVFNPTMAEAVKSALNRENHRNINSDKQRQQPKEEKSRHFKLSRRNPQKKTKKQFLEEVYETQELVS